jgi:hypothetical protein
MICYPALRGLLQAPLAASFSIAEVGNGKGTGARGMR